MSRTILGVAVLSLWICAAPAGAEELVTFDSIASHRYQTPLLRKRGEAASLIPGTLIQGYLSKPEGTGPFPAVVLLPPCNGVPATRRQIADTITGFGYVALFVDDFTTRGLRQSCVGSTFNETVQDALGGLAYVAHLPFVDAKRLAIVGFAQGGNTALKIALNRLPPLAGGVSPPLPKAVVSFYPWCADIGGRLAMPALVLIGGRDDWMPSALCEQLTHQHSGDGPDLKLVVYPAAHHAFGDPGADGRNVFGHWLQYDADAAARAMAETRAFLAKHLGAN